MRDARPLTLQVVVEKWPLKAPFRITGYTFYDLDVVVVTLAQNGHIGRGEAAGVYYLNDDTARMVRQIENVRAAIEAGVDRESLLRLLPHGGARNAVDCALWDLEAKQVGKSAWQLAGLEAPKPLLTTYTLSADDPERMVASAQAFADARALKLKLTGEPLDAERVRAVREVRPDVWLAVDANQGFTRESLLQLMPVLVENQVQLIEQPFKIGQEVQLDGLLSPVPIAADESVQDSADVGCLAGRVDVINIKLDKCGGLTEALKMAKLARELGLGLMVGNMTGTALAMAPAMLVGQLCKVVDLDGPLFLAEDRWPPARYSQGTVWCRPELWGNPLAAAVSRQTTHAP